MNPKLYIPAIPTGEIMPRKRTSIIWTTNRQQLQKIINESSAITEVLKKLGLDPYAGNHKTLHARIQEDKINIKELTNKRNKQRSKHLKTLQSTNKMSNDQIFCLNTHRSSKNLKRRIINENLLPCHCAICGIKNTWNHKPLSLQLDHIDGDKKNNQLSNLRLLCPNCHSQTDNFAGRKARKKRFCNQCKKPIKTKNKYCEECLSKVLGNKTRKFNPSKEHLSKTIVNFNYNICAVGRHFGVSDNAIRKRCRLLKISHTKKGRTGSNRHNRIGSASLCH